MARNKDAASGEHDLFSAPGATLDELVHTYGVRSQPPPPSGNTLLVGEVLDTHHPHRPGRALVRWEDAEQTVHEHWLSRALHVPLRIGTRVLLSRPANWPEWVVTGALADVPPSCSPEPDVEDDRAPSRGSLRLEANEVVRIESADGTPLFELSHRDRGAVLRLHRDLDLELPGTFRVQAERIELCSGQGGTDARSDGEMVFRSPRIRLN